MAVSGNREKETAAWEADNDGQSMGDLRGIAVVLKDSALWRRFVDNVGTEAVKRQEARLISARGGNSCLAQRWKTSQDVFALGGSRREEGSHGRQLFSGLDHGWPAWFWYWALGFPQQYKC